MTGVVERRARPRRSGLSPAFETLEGRQLLSLAAPRPATTASRLPSLLTPADVEILLQRAAAATPSADALIAVVDRNGRPLGVRSEASVPREILADPATLTFAVDGALAKARSAAFFSSNAAAITSRTVQFVSQSTITEREVNSSPDVLDPSSPSRGPGFVAPIGIKALFPPGVRFRPPGDFFLIEHTNRDSLVVPGPDFIFGTFDDVILPARFNINPAFIPAGKDLFAPESYGLVSGIFPAGQSRGLATLPGGVPLFKNGTLVGGIGVFFPGRSGFASEENSALNEVGFLSARRDRSAEAEYIAFAAAGGSSAANARVGTIGGVRVPRGFDLPFGRIDLNGVTLPVYGSGGLQGPARLLAFGRTLGGTGDPTSGRNLPVTPGIDGLASTADDITLLPGLPVPDGLLVVPHDGVGLAAADVQRILDQGLRAASRTRSNVRLPIGSRARVTIAVTDLTGEVLGLFRMPDAPVFGLDAAVAQARNTAYYANARLLQPADSLEPFLPPGLAFSSRSFRYLTQPRFPEGSSSRIPGPFSILNDGGVNPLNGRTIGAPLPPDAFQSVQGYNAFRPRTNFRDPSNPLNQNGVVFFPGGVPLFGGGVRDLAGGLGVAGDAVDFADFIASRASQGFTPTPNVLRVDRLPFRGIRIPYQNFPRNPMG